MTPEQFAFVLRAAVTFRAADDRIVYGPAAFNAEQELATDAINKGIALLQAAERLRAQYKLPLSAYVAIGETPTVVSRTQVVRSEEPREDG